MDCEISRVQAVTAELTEAFERLMPQLSPAPAPAREALEEMLASQVVLLFVARCPPDGRITGALALAVVRVPSGVRAWIEDVVVDQAARRQGIGEALTRAALQAARERGAASRARARREGSRADFQPRPPGRQPALPAARLCPPGDTLLPILFRQNLRRFELSTPPACHTLSAARRKKPWRGSLYFAVQ